MTDTSHPDGKINYKPTAGRASSDAEVKTRQDAPKRDVIASFDIANDPTYERATAEGTVMWRAGGLVTDLTGHAGKVREHLEYSLASSSAGTEENLREEKPTPHLGIHKKHTLRHHGIHRPPQETLC